MYLIYLLNKTYEINKGILHEQKKTVSFTQMKTGTIEDYNLLNQYATEYAKGTASNILNAMR